MKEKIIEELTDEQDHLMATIAAEYESKALSGDDSHNPRLIQEGIDFIYGLSDLKPPEIVICSSPADMVTQAKVEKGNSFDALGCGYDSGWTAFYDFFERIGVPLEKEWNFTTWKNFILNSGVFASLLFENVAFVCIRPYVVKRNSAGDLHCVDGPAIAWSDGYSEYALNGVWMEEKIVMTPVEKLDAKTILKEKNAEVRREIVRKVGIEKICRDLDSEILDQFGDYELLGLKLGDGRVRPYLKMKNPSIGTYHIEGVHPNVKTCEEALAWRNGQKKYVAPKILT